MYRIALSENAWYSIDGKIPLADTYGSELNQLSDPNQHGPNGYLKRDGDSVVILWGNRSASGSALCMRNPFSLPANWANPMRVIEGSEMNQWEN